MHRREVLTRYVTKDMLGIEVGPWFAPLVPKAEGYRSLALDFYDHAALLERAKADPGIAEEGYDLIEEVDLVGGATDIAALVEAKGLTGQIDYIVSSHNFEHLPNPILFLQGCQKVLKPGGFVSMAIPDRRGTFDFFRPFSTTADFLDAFVSDRKRPSAASIFEVNSLLARKRVDDAILGCWDWKTDGGTLYTETDLTPLYGWYEALAAQTDGEYVDNHCSVFTRSSFELIVRDLHFIGLIALGVDMMDGPDGCEFYTRLINGLPKPTKAAFDARRAALLQDVIDESAENSRKMGALTRKVAEQEELIRLLDARILSLRAARHA